MKVHAAWGRGVLVLGTTPGDPNLQALSEASEEVCCLPSPTWILSRDSTGAELKDRTGRQ